MKKIIILLLVLLASGCSLKKEKQELNKENKDKEEIKEEKIVDEYKDDNPIKLGIFEVDNNYHNKKVIEDAFYTDFKSLTDLGSFEVFFTNDKTVDGSSFKDTWNKYYNKYENIDSYKIGYNIKFILSDGTNFESNFLEPDIFKFNEYFYVYLYDDVNQKDGAFYSHLEEVNDNTLMTSIKIFGVEKIDEVENIILTAFTYKSDEDFDKDGNYRGNSRYTIRIKKNV